MSKDIYSFKISSLIALFVCGTSEAGIFHQILSNGWIETLLLSELSSAEVQIDDRQISPYGAKLGAVATAGTASNDERNNKTSEVFL